MRICITFDVHSVFWFMYSIGHYDSLINLRKGEGLITSWRNAHRSWCGQLLLMVHCSTNAVLVSELALFSLGAGHRNWAVLDVVDKLATSIGCVTSTDRSAICRVRNGVAFTEHDVVGGLRVDWCNFNG